MAKTDHSALQDPFLNDMRRRKVKLTVYLVNGFLLKGIILGYDHFCVLLESEGKQQLIYKHAISTIMQGHPPMKHDKE
ncbi:RNA chaperone Hfq [Sulfoacidibacillus ferrooxidans]|uniref:RNA-binding protein Hfq n=1 Tax=Sulfoacidibacillus ferrooxidans TaxID=2005001 RepID=A0A9X2AFS2_9BACL|nr:RNA chaperone Hfq [Sulfoacidibacillus ferrooxidans]MCI0184752.1 RNA-binding protein Hfq [Sulfoacidibacillus ferrooxidans]